jgi:hypothetical protein
MSNPSDDNSPSPWQVALPPGEGRGEISPKAGSRVELLNRQQCLSISNHRTTILPLLGERAGVRESLSDADIRATVHGEGDSRHLGRAEKNLAEPKVAEQSSERRERVNLSNADIRPPVHGEGERRYSPLVHGVEKSLMAMPCRSVGPTD